MSSLPPPPGTPAPPGPVPPPPGPRTSGVPTGLKVGFGVLGLALIGGAAFAGYQVYDTLSGGGAQPADVLPATTVAYTRLDLDPSASQKIALLDLIDRVPEVKEGLGLEDVESQADLREVAFTDWFGLEDACGVDYADDVQPWIGERVGLGLVGGFDITDDEDETALNVAENAVLVIQVTDEDAARTGITRLAQDCGILDDIAGDLGTDLGEPGIVFRDGYALVTISQDSADAIDRAADEGTLGADNAKFTDDMDRLGEDGVASLWYDQGALYDTAQEALEELGDDAPDDVQEILDYYAQVDTAALTLRAADDSLEAAGVTTLTDELDVPDADGLAGLPEDTMIGLSLVGGSSLADELWASVTSFGELFFGFGALDYDDYCFPDPTAPEGDSQPECSPPPTFEDTVEQFEDETGLSFPDDLATLLGDELSVYVGDDGVDDLQRADDLEEALEILSAGLEFRSPGDVAGVLETLLDYSGIPLELTETDDGAIVATNADTADTIESDDGLGGTDQFGTVVEDHDQALGGLYVDIASLVDALKALGAPVDDLDDLSFLRALGVTSWLEDGNVVSFSAKLSFTPQD
jgi:hypothetical protein